MSKASQSGWELTLWPLLPRQLNWQGCLHCAFACIGEYAEVGDNTVIHPHVTIGSGAKVGNDCIIYANSTIYHDCRVGNHCILHSGCVIGADGFGFAPTSEGYEKYRK